MVKRLQPIQASAFWHCFQGSGQRVLGEVVVTVFRLCCSGSEKLLALCPGSGTDVEVPRCGCRSSGNTSSSSSSQ